MVLAGKSISFILQRSILSINKPRFSCLSISLIRNCAIQNYLRLARGPCVSLGPPPIRSSFGHLPHQSSNLSSSLPSALNLDTLPRTALTSTFASLAVALPKDSTKAFSS